MNSNPAPGRVLFVDDDINLLAAFQRTLRRTFDLEVAAGGAEALEKIAASPPFAVIVADMRMPVMDGIELLERVRSVAPDTVRIMLTGNADQQTAVDAVNRGQIFRFLNKPCAPDVMQEALQNALTHHAALKRERELIEGTLAGCVDLMAEILGAVAPEALGHGQRLRDSARVLCRFLRVPDAWTIELAAQLSGIGCATLPPALLRKLAASAELSPEERAIAARVPRIGHDLLAHIPRLEPVARIVLYQHQRIDGTGTPGDGVAAGALPLGARILRILHDRLELENDGVVRQAALAAMRERRGFYDAELLTGCFECMPDYLVQPISADRDVRAARMHELKPGHVVVSDVTGANGVVYVGSGQRLTATMIARLQAYVELGHLREPILVQEPA